ncbi:MULTISPECIES: YpfN family protein [unclassified Gilliamella]|uniref:YpfN family protein n=1 Tax=unclassified Gilliamella TaxID=2685620 RepID=UPI00080DC233|nr:YpfN family protein [Gilliamella apicola]OCG22989.1 hypothetical protein A9G23_02070 [Gilliamella apicola]OCG25355.1 hypothetical protein A9G22_00585 [Gilliamella apicola]
MTWLKDYWWIIVVILIGIFINTIKALNRLSYKTYLEKKKGIKPIPYQDDDDDDWPSTKSTKKK